jgi:hypothetical protein
MNSHQNIIVINSITNIFLLAIDFFPFAPKNFNINNQSPIASNRLEVANSSLFLRSEI